MKDYTFGQAKKLLSKAPYLHGTTDVGEQINNAVSALAGLNGWECLRRLVRLFSATPVFSLPQGVAGLVRVCVNGTPASLRGTDYQFLHSGPGDLDNYLKQGFSLLRTAEVADLGFSPVMHQPEDAMVLAATAMHVDDGRPQAPLTVAGVSPTGERVSTRLDVLQGEAGAPGYEAFYQGQEQPFMSIESVVLDPYADDYITLWGMSRRGRIVMLGHYHPSVSVPKFRQYRIKGTRRGPFDILAEVRVDPLPLVNDDDVIPLPSLEPVRLMMLYEHQVAMNELQSAQQYMQQAMQWLQQMQVADNTVQAPVVQNVLFEGSGGDVESSWNL